MVGAEKAPVKPKVLLREEFLAAVAAVAQKAFFSNVYILKGGGESTAIRKFG